MSLEHPYTQVDSGGSEEEDSNENPKNRPPLRRETKELREAHKNGLPELIENDRQTAEAETRAKFIKSLEEWLQLEDVTDENFSKDFKLEWKKYIVRPNVWYGFEVHTGSFMKRIYQTKSFVRKLTSNQVHLWWIRRVLIHCKICVECGLKTYLEALNILEDEKKRPLPQSLVTIADLYLGNPKKVENLMSAVFEATSPHAPPHNISHHQGNDEGIFEKKKIEKKSLECTLPNKVFVTRNTYNKENLNPDMLQVELKNLKDQHLLLFPFTIWELRKLPLNIKTLAKYLEKQNYKLKWMMVKDDIVSDISLEELNGEVNTMCTLVFMKDTMEEAEERQLEGKILKAESPEFPSMNDQSSTYSKIVQQWYYEAENWREKMRKDQVTKALEIGITKLIWILRNSIKYTGDDLCSVVNRYHKQIFSAAGDRITQANYPPKMERDVEVMLKQLTDLLIREALCMLAEQVRHSPWRITYLFLKMRNKFPHLTMPEDLPSQFVPIIPIKAERQKQDEEKWTGVPSKQSTKKEERKKEEWKDDETPVNIMDPVKDNVEDKLKVRESISRRLGGVIINENKAAPTTLQFLDYQQDMSHLRPSGEDPTIIAKSILQSSFGRSLHDLIYHHMGDIKDGFKDFKEDKYNFDDIDDCGKWNEEKLKRTYKEPWSVFVLLFIAFKFAPEIITFKLWTVFLVYALYKSFSLSKETIQVLMAIDIFSNLLFFVSSWLLRLYSTSYKNLKPIDFTIAGCSLLIRLIADAVVVVASIAAILWLASKKHGGISISSLLEVLSDIAIPYYVSLRPAFAFIFHVLLPMQSVAITKTPVMIRKASPGLKGVITRASVRITFMACFLLLTSVYEYFLIVPSFDSLASSVYCGDRQHSWSNSFSVWNTQGLICDSSVIIAAIVIISGVAIDNGLAFIVCMTFFGFFLGAPKQGESRSLVKLTKHELREKILQRFSIYCKPTSEVQQQEELADKVWHWCIQSWRKDDYISDRECEQLKGDIIDVSKLSSPQACENIGFWINSLTTEPLVQLKWDKLPSTAIIIPVYTEKLEFPWKDDPSKNYYPLDEAPYLISQFPQEWLNLQERLKKKKEKKPNFDEKLEMTKWFSMHDQLVYRTVKGAVMYYKALRFLLELEKGYTKEIAKKLAKDKVEVIVPYQGYQKNPHLHPVVHRWLKKWPVLKIVYDFDRRFDPSKPIPKELIENIPQTYEYASCCMYWDTDGNRMVYRVIPRENPLIIETQANNKLQGKAMNQSNGMIWATSDFIQALDANQGGLATEYLKFPALINNFKFRRDGSIRRRIIGSRENIFTGALTTVGSFHAHQEWSFGTLILRVYSALGIRLHYGHPDIFHGPWAWAHSGLSKMNPIINTSEDVFAGFGTLQCNERTTHVEHIQFDKGRETGLVAMSGFDRKISAGNSALLRSRDLYHLMERLPFFKRFLFFYGIAGHFLTNSLMVASLGWYIWSLFFYSLAGVSLQALGGTIFSTEWVLHAGSIAAIPLLAELVVEKGPLLGIIHALIFIPFSTIAFLFQMQTKHSGFTDGVVTGKAAHIDTGRGLAIFRKSTISLFSTFAHSHFFPVVDVLAISIAYWCTEGQLHGGTLPFIMIYIFVFCIIISPQLFNPTLKGNSFYELIEDSMEYIAWIGKPTARVTLEEWEKNFEQLKEEDIWKKFEPDFVRFCAVKDFHSLPTSRADAIGYMIILFIFQFGFWVAFATFLLYPDMQLWLCHFLLCWSIFMLIYWCFLMNEELRVYLNPVAIFLYVLWIILFVYAVVAFSSQRVTPWANIYVAMFIFVKILQGFRAFLLSLVTFAAFTQKKYQINRRCCCFSACTHPDDAIHTAEDKGKLDAKRYAFIVYNVILINTLFMVPFLRSVVASAWGIVAFLVALIMRPLWGNLLLFGKYTGLEKEITVKFSSKHVSLGLSGLKEKFQTFYESGRPPARTAPAEQRERPRDVPRETLSIPGTVAVTPEGNSNGAARQRTLGRQLKSKLVPGDRVVVKFGDSLNHGTVIQLNDKSVEVKIDDGRVVWADRMNVELLMK